jgi:hypothetical protein
MHKHSLFEQAAPETSFARQAERSVPLPAPSFQEPSANPFTQQKRASGGSPKWKTAPARITFFQYRNICHIGVTMSI